MIRHIISGLLLFVATISLAFAQPGGRGPMNNKGMGQRHDALIERLNLTDAQELQMKNLRIDLMKKQTALRSKIQTLRLDNQQAFLAEKVDRSTIEKNVKAITSTEEQLKLNMVDHWFEVNKLLTPDQQKVWKDHAIMMGKEIRGEMRGHGRMMFRGGFDRDNDDD